MFTTDSRTENFLTSLGVRFKYKNGLKFPSSLMPMWDKENLGRPVAIRENAVFQYASRMENGSAAPAPILVDTPNGYRVCDGIQRLSAEILMQTTEISAYVVETDSPRMLLTMRVMANQCMQGFAEPPEWTRRRAVEVLMVDEGMSAAEVAKLGGWSTTDLKRIAEAIKLQAKITQAGGPDLPDSMLAELRPYLDDSDKPYLTQAQVPVIKFLNILKSSGMPLVDAKPYLMPFFAPVPKGKVMHKELTKRLEDVQEEPEIRTRLTGRQRTELPKDVVLRKNLKAAETTLDHIISSGFEVTNVDEFFGIFARLNRKLKAHSGRKTARGDS